MPSKSYDRWAGDRAAALDEIESAHVAVGGRGRGRRYATRQINQAYAILLSSQFQGYCRDLHTEAVDCLASSLEPVAAQAAIRAHLMAGRKLDHGNPNPANIGHDFERFDAVVWEDLRLASPRNGSRQRLLQQLSNWRNAIAHQDFDAARLGGRVTLGLADVRRWRRACAALARALDQLIADRLAALVGRTPW